MGKLNIHSSSTAPVRGAAGVAIRTALQSGNLASDWCYFDRNANNFWHPGLFRDEDLYKCLSVSGEKDWWKSIPGMTQEDACFETNNALILDGYKNQRDAIRKQMGC